MAVSYIEGQVQRVNRNLLIVNGGCLTVLFLFAAFMMLGGWLMGRSFDRLHSMNASHDGSGVTSQQRPADMAHPVTISAADLTEPRLRELEGRAVTLSDKHIVDLAFPVWDSLTGATGKGRTQRPPDYHVLNANGRPFVILPANRNAGHTFTGVIRPLSAENRNAVTTVIQSRGMWQPIQPYALDCISSQPGAAAKAIPTAKAQPVEMHPVSGPSGFPTFLIPYALLMGLLGWNVFKALFRMKNPLTHPIYAKLGQYGPPLDVARAIDAERRQGVQTISPAEFTWSWMLVPTFFGLKVVHLDHIIWIFQMVSRVNFIPVLTSLRVVERQGYGIQVFAGPPALQRIMDYILQSRPWILSGFDRALQERCSKNRASVIAEVDARRQQRQPVQTAPQPAYPAQSRTY